jgi:hypothetical protein
MSYWHGTGVIAQFTGCVVLSVESGSFPPPQAARSDTRTKQSRSFVFIKTA